MEYANLSFEKDDKLDRGFDVKSIMRIIATFDKRIGSNGSISIAINSEWGTGKSYFVNMWKNWLNSDEFKDFRIVYYNAWEYDDCETPLLPLMYKIISVTSREDDDNFVEHAKLFFKACGWSALKIGIGKLLGDNADLADIISGGIDSISEADTKTIFDEFDQYYNNRQVFAEKLQELIPEYGQGKLWIFIDELDRCRPDFAIKTLEIIKHYFDTNNIIFVFSIDLEQLSNTVKKVYGEKVDAESYLRKFFDFIYNLTTPNIKQYMSYLYEKYKQLNQGNNVLEDKDIQNYITYLFKEFELSLRDIDLTFNHIIYFLEYYYDDISHLKDREKALRIYLYFLVIKDKYNNDYRILLHGEFSMDANQNSQWETVKRKFVVNAEIKKFLTDISNKKADEPVIGLKNKYGLFEKGLNSSFLIHMENILNYKE